MTNEFFAETYSAKALAIREWVLREISSFRSKGSSAGLGFMDSGVQGLGMFLGLGLE